MEFTTTTIQTVKINYVPADLFNIVSKFQKDGFEVVNMSFDTLNRIRVDLYLIDGFNSEYDDLDTKDYTLSLFFVKESPTVYFFVDKLTGYNTENFLYTDHTEAIDKFVYWVENLYI